MQNTNDFNKIFSNPSYSKNSKSQASSLSITDPKKRYVTVIQQQKDNQRKQLHRKLQKQKEEDEKMYRRHLKAEIKKRRKELEQLQHLKETGAEEYKKAAHQAEIKKEKDNIKKLEESIKLKMANQKSNKRFKQAVQKQKLIDDEINKKKIQAKYMRNTHLKSEVAQRETAVKFSKSLQQRQVKEQQQKAKIQTQNFEIFKKGMNVHGLSHRILNSSRPVTFIVKQNEQDNDAINEARKQQLRNSQKQKLREEVLHKNRKVAEQRGNAVLSRMQRQKEYERYCKQAQQQQKRYNLRRLQAGKRNQYAGVKPLTLSQIDINKKNRSQQQFQKMFLDKTQTPAHTNEPANKYKIIEAKMINIIPQAVKTQKWTKKPINYGDNESLIPGVSQGHYQFEQGAEVQQFQKQVKLQRSKKEEHKPMMKNVGLSKKQQVTKNRLKETKMTNEAFKQELDYSDSEQDSNI